MIVSRRRIIAFLNNVKFKLIVLFRTMKILLKFDKSIHTIKLDYHTKYIFEKSYFAIAYKFKNALWYEFKNIKTTTKDSIVLFNRDTIETPIIFIVHGLFNEKKFVIDISSDTKFASASFLTSVTNLSAFEYNSKEFKLTLSSPLFIQKDISFSIKPEIQQKAVNISFSQFKESDYL